ncbi:asparagine synthase-related protein [Halorubellus litoreus]|uniref:Asparagine synthase-related protein n=1 Tax=Halorubellus litoreus TaxID=755308 RepID=A0ABD5V8Y3_9EURY
MVGIAGVLGDGRLPDDVASWTQWRDDEASFEYVDDYVDLELRAHPVQVDDQPVALDDGDVLLWVWGDVFGHGTRGEYTPRPGGPDASADYCATLYERHGLEFVEELNGHYAIVLYDRADRELTFVTDRFATHPIYHASVGGSVAFASNPQALTAHPDVSPAFDEDYLHEYLALRRVFGRETALEDVRELPPATTVTVDLDDFATSHETYWRPTYEPEDRPFSYFVDRLVDVLCTMFADWTTDDLAYGTLLSGGSDSRIVQAAIDQSVVAFHNADWMSREARIANRVADSAGDEFCLLERYDDHEARTLTTTPRLSSFSGWFDQAYFAEFQDEITDRVDVLVSGLFADMLFDGGPLQTRTVSLGSVGTVDLPVETPIESVDDYVDAKVSSATEVPYFDANRDLADVVRDNIQVLEDGRVVSHGVEYASLEDLVMYGDYYPLGADTEAIFPRSLGQMRPYRTPFLDNRVVDLHRRMPQQFFLRRNVVNAALESISPALAEIPHSRTGVSLKRSFPAAFLSRNITGFYRKHLDDEPTPQPHFTHKPWPDRSELLRVSPFAIDAIRENEHVLDALPFLDADAAERTYAEHVDGAEYHQVLYSLLTLLEMPVTERVAGVDEDAANDDSEDDSGRRGVVASSIGRDEPGGGDA